MQIKDLGREAIDEILTEALDGMVRRMGPGWVLDLHGEHGDLKVRRDGKHITTANVTPHLAGPMDDEPRPPEAIRFRTALRRLVLETTIAFTPVPGAADVPAALGCTWRAIEAVDVISKEGFSASIPGLRHDLYRILDHLTGNDHSGCSGKLGVADFGRVVPLAQEPKLVPIESDIAAVREALAEAEANCWDDCDVDGRAHVRSLRKCLDGLLAEQRRGA